MNRRQFTRNSALGALGLAIGNSFFSQAHAAQDALAMSWDEWGKLDATGMARLLVAGKITPAEVAAQAAKASELVNPKLNCVIEVFEDVVKNPLKDGMNVNGPFHGVPMFVKDTGSHLKGRLQEKNSIFSRGSRSDYDDPLMRNFRRGGFNVLGRATMGALHITEGLLTGFTLNPWDLEHTPGGSSGGSAASVASGIVPLSHASDGGGSTRSPATLNGLVGHKPTRGLLPNLDGMSYDMAYMVTEGVITRSVRDQANAYDQMIWRSPSDPAFIPVQMPSVPFSERIKRDPTRLRIALSTGNWSRRAADKSGRPVNPEVIARTRQVAKQLESLGHTVVEVDEDQICDFEKLYKAFEWFYLYVYDWTAQSEQSGVPINEKTLEPAFRAMVEHQKRHPKPAGLVDAARAANAQLAGQWAKFYAEYDLLLTPSDGDGAMKANGKGELSLFAPLESEADYLNWIEDHMDDARYFIPANAMGFPAISFPTGMLKSGLPCGAQLHGRWGDDGRVMQVAAQIERTKPEWFGTKPPVHVSNL
ncbi:6-aminohexanoate-cyclic-dimer hydrolase [Planctomycetes bacterium CA13]|uniref:6-aminohexanoate-cyclic-dimer hydrolase n=1 Tax=Novipirellula herctigrandis TaxID=2527986 RepID=A0A5C5ZBK5_9BACT|nr:6-aminohexanoate-cyclic-dimer hydrolase [Planctomycetes bacterium CA13]